MQLFAYGTLMDAQRLEGVIGRHPGEPIPAQLVGYVLLRNRYGEPAISPSASTDRVMGLVWTGITPAERLALDDYETPEDGTHAYSLAQVRVLTEGGEMEVWTYVGHPDSLEAGGHNNATPATGQG